MEISLNYHKEHILIHFRTNFTKIYRNAENEAGSKSTILTVEINGNTFENHTREQVHSNSFTERVRKRSFVGFKLSRIQRSYKHFRIRKFRIHNLSVIILYRIHVLSVNGKTNPMSKHLGLATNPESFALV